MKANSPPGASSRPVSTLAPNGTPNSRQSGASSTVLTTIMARKPPATSSGSRQMKPRSICMPTEKKKTPSSRPRKGSIIASTARRYSVSASSRPAMKAPSAIDRPAEAAITPEPTAISSVAAMKNSGLSVPAASRNSGFSTTPADHGDHGDGDGRLDQRDDHALATDGAVAAAAQRADQEQERHHGEVLGEQDGEAGAAGGRHHAALAATALP